MTNRDAAARKLIDRLVPDPSDGQIIGLLATSYELNPEFFETDYLPSVLGLGSWSDRKWASRIVLERHLALASAATVLLDGTRYRARPHSLRVETIPVALGRGSALHAKISLVVHERAVRLLVGSSNLTEQGYRKNREVAVALKATERAPDEAALMKTAITELPSLFGTWWTHGAQRVVDDALGLLSQWTARRDNESWFAWTGPARTPLWEQFAARWPTEEPIHGLTVVSPFWSDDADHGPVQRFIRAMEGHSGGLSGAHVRLLTGAKPDGLKTWRPVLPESYGRFRIDGHGLTVVAEAVEPFASESEVDSSAVAGGIRPLHAKVVLVEGPSTSLAYAGSGNFTRRGWGFHENVDAVNMEGGLILRRRGKAREGLRQLIPPTVGTPVSLDGAASGRLALPDPKSKEAPWPSFVREVVLVPANQNPSILDLRVEIIADEVSGDWEIRTSGEPSSAGLVLASGGPNQRADQQIPLEDAQLKLLLQDKEVRVVWWEFPEGRLFPINVEEAARDQLPIGHGDSEPGEGHLLAYYQGRISWEDLFPDPESGGHEFGRNPVDDDVRFVDTQSIQSYQIRGFVEALRGISDDLRSAAASPGAMRLALNGAVSPVALARQVLIAVREHRRTPVAGGFQLLEIIACLSSARGYAVPDKYRSDWRMLVSNAEQEVGRLLQELRDASGEALSGSRSFSTYERTMREFYRRQEAMS